MNMLSNSVDDRRMKPRMDYAVQVAVRGADSAGGIYRFNTVARNLGSGGLSAFSPRTLCPGEKISVKVRFARPGSRQAAPEFHARATVLRVEERPGGACVFAASFLFR